MSKTRLFCTAACLTFAAATAHAAETAPITIGVPVGLSGANSVVAPSVVQAAELAVEEINAKGGVLGRKLALDVADDASGAAVTFYFQYCAKGVGFARPLFILQERSTQQEHRAARTGTTARDGR